MLHNSMTVHIEPIARLTDRVRHVLIAQLGVIDFIHFFLDSSGRAAAMPQPSVCGFSRFGVKNIVADIKARQSQSEALA